MPESESRLIVSYTIHTLGFYWNLLAA